MLYQQDGLHVCPWVRHKSQINPLLQADKYGVPRICFVNKMDRMGANFHRTVEMIVTNLAAKPLVLQVRPGLHGSQNLWQVWRGCEMRVPGS